MFKGAGAQIVGGIEPEIAVDHNADVRVGVFVDNGGRHWHVDGERVGRYKALAGIGQGDIRRANHHQIGAIGVDHQIIVIEEVGDDLGDGGGKGETGVAVESALNPQFLYPGFTGCVQDEVDHRDDADNNGASNVGVAQCDEEDRDQARRHCIGKGFVELRATGGIAAGDRAIDKEAPDERQAQRQAHAGREFYLPSTVLPACHHLAERWFLTTVDFHNLQLPFVVVDRR